MIEHSRLLEILFYDPATGDFTWLESRCRGMLGKLAGSTHPVDGYRYVKINGKSYSQHRLAFFYMTKRWPVADLDHKDTDRSNNRWLNLREATRIQNCGNSKAKGNGLKGTFRRENGKWRAKIRFEGKQINIGQFDTSEEAHEAYLAKAKELFGEFARAA